jgi:hypothetical protein
MSELTLRFLKRFGNVALVFAALAFTVFAYGTASAGLDACAGDPVLHLSNGKTMTINVTIGTSASNVTAVDYEVHVPRGVKLVGKPEWFGDPALIAVENLKFRDDAPAGQYTSDTFVTTKIDHVKVSATTTLDNRSKKVSGFNGQHLTTTFNVER